MEYGQEAGGQGEAIRYERSAYVTMARSDPRGTFTVSSLPPGDYYVVAVDRPAIEEWREGEWHADSLNGLMSWGQRVTLRERQRTSVELRGVRLPGP